MPDIALVNVPDELIVEGSFLAQFQGGLAHGSAYIADCQDSYNVAFAEEPDNRERFARLAVLYGWTLADDRQFLYRATPPRLVFSVDHDNFLYGSDWSEEALAVAPTAVPDASLIIDAAVSGGLLQTALKQLGTISNDDIAEGVASPPQSWNLTMDDRITLAHYLAGARDELLASRDPAV